MKTKTILAQVKDHGPYLAMARIPAPAWAAFFPGERDLYALWTRKLLPVFTDRSRISRADLSDADRALSVCLLEVLAARAFRMRRMESMGGDLASRFATEAADPGHATPCELVIRLPLHPHESRGEISLRAWNGPADVALKLEWQPQADPERGTILLYPCRSKPQYRFGIAAYNRRQFVNICRALVDYCAPGEKLPALQPLPGGPARAQARAPGRVPTAAEATVDLGGGATRIGRAERDRWAD